MLNEHAALLFSESVISQPHIYLCVKEYSGAMSNANNMK